MNNMFPNKQVEMSGLEPKACLRVHFQTYLVLYDNYIYIKKSYPIGTCLSNKQCFNFTTWIPVPSSMLTAYWILQAICRAPKYFK